MLSECAKSAVEKASERVFAAETVLRMKQAGLQTK